MGGKKYFLLYAIDRDTFGRSCKNECGTTNALDAFEVDSAAVASSVIGGMIIPSRELSRPGMAILYKEVSRSCPYWVST